MVNWQFWNFFSRTSWILKLLAHSSVREIHLNPVTTHFSKQGQRSGRTIHSLLLCHVLPLASSRHSQRQKAGREKLHLSPISTRTCPSILVSKEAVEILHCYGVGTAIHGSLPVSHVGSVWWLPVLSYGCMITPDSECLHQIQRRTCRKLQNSIQHSVENTPWKKNKPKTIPNQPPPKFFLLS